MKIDEKIIFPPSSLVELRRLPSLIKRGEVKLSIGKRSLTALCIMLDDPYLAATQNITQLSMTTGVSPASITRLAKLLGFVGFNAFQSLFIDDMKMPGRYYSGQAENLISDHSPERFISEQLAQQKAGLEKVALSLDKLFLDRAVNGLLRAKKIWISGSRQSFGLATLMNYELGLIRPGVSIVNATGEGLTTALAEASTQDLVIVFGSEPYSRTTVLLAQAAKAIEVPLLAITDSFHSPLAQLANIHLLAETQSRFYTNSMVSTVFLMETLLIEVAKRLGKRAVERLRKREELISKLNDEF